MRIAIPVADENLVAEEFSRAGLFAIYDIHDQTRVVGYVGRETLAEPGCGRTPGFLRQHGVEVVLGHRVSENAVNHLLEVGIVAIKDAPVLSPDALISHLVSGTLQATPPDVAMHGGGCGGGGGGAGGGCGHCGSHSHEAEEVQQHACGNTPAAECGGCSGHDHARLI